METYWERRRNNQEENHSPSQMDVTAVNPGSSPGEKDKPDESGSRISSGSLSNEKRPTKKNSQKENKKHPYKKVRK